MMRKVFVFLCAVVLLFGVVGTVNASLTTIGTATYMGSDYNLIYEDDSIDGGLVWLDYTNNFDTWQNQVGWASGLGSSDLAVTLYDGYTTDIDWGTGWRLPLTQDALSGFDQSGSEMGHLYHESLGNVAYDDPGWGLQNTGDFIYLQSDYYWSGTEYSPDPVLAWVFLFSHGYQLSYGKGSSVYALAVHPGTVSTVPIPSAIWLLGSGLIGLMGFKRKFKKA